MTGVEELFARAMGVADSVLHEGQVLYPYRASALKNRMRWQFGVLGPPATERHPGADRSWCRTECVLDAPDGATLAVAVRFLRPCRDSTGWLTAAVERVDVTVRVPGVAGVDFDGGQVEVEVKRDDAGMLRVSCRIANTSRWEVDQAVYDRDVALEHSLVATHTLLGCPDGSFISMVAPRSAAGSVAACDNVRTWPVLVGRSAMLSCPVILYDQPEVAPESMGHGCDSLEIEELLALRVMTLTDQEKAEARATDPVAAALLDRVDGLGRSVHELHGRLRDGMPQRGDQVVLRPHRRADAHDMFLAGRHATVVGTVTDVDGSAYVQVTVDDDPGRDIQEWYGRSWFFAPDEVEPVPDEPVPVEPVPDEPELDGLVPGRIMPDRGRQAP